MSDTKLVRCTTCGGVGTVPKAYPAGTVMCYAGSNGENWPQEFCWTCHGSGWISEPVGIATDE